MIDNHVGYHSFSFIPSTSTLALTLEEEMAKKLIMKLSYLPLKKRSCLLLLSSVTTSSWCNVEAFSIVPTTRGYSATHRQEQQKQSLLSYNNVQQILNQRDYNKVTKLQQSSYNSDSRYQGSQSGQPLRFRKGDPIQVEVVRFGPLGASVEIIAHKSHEEKDLIPEGEEPMGYGLILQREIGYFRSSRRGVDVVCGEILPAYVDWVRDDGKVDITLRKPGGKGKADDLGKEILAKLQAVEGGEVAVGDKSTPNAINEMFPGASKASFKRAVAALYKKKLVQPGPHTTKLM